MLADSTGNPNTTVFVRKGTKDKKYHLQADCRGLSGCQHRIVKMKLLDAQKAELDRCEIIDIDPSTQIDYEESEHYYYDRTAPYSGELPRLELCLSVLKDWGVEKQIPFSDILFQLDEVAAKNIHNCDSQTTILSSS